VLVSLALLSGVHARNRKQLPQFPKDFTAYEMDQLLQFQGDYSTQGNLLCCPLDSPACQIQVQTQEGPMYFDFTHNRTRMDVGGGQAMVNLYDIQKELLVVNQTCKEYCPMEGDVLSPFGVDPSAADIGHKLINGVMCDDWNWKEVILKIITMEISDMYVDQSDPNNPIPVAEVDQLTPFGQFIGTMNSTWSQFTAGTPDPSLFIIAGIDSCPQSSQCGNSQLQLNRIRGRRWLSWYRYSGLGDFDN